jgi:predicted enzyme related to lactoylglutathione lyase
MTNEFRNAREPLSVKASDLSESQFSDTRLEKSTFDDVNLRQTSFHNVNLSEASFSDVNLANASIENANVSGMRIEGVLVSELMKAHRTRSKLKPGIVIFARDVARVATFYEQVAAMSEVHSAGGHVALESEHLQLVIHVISQRVEVSDPPKVRENASMKLCLPVSSIAGARETARKLGGMVGPEADEWEALGFRACDGHDPEGNVIQVREPAS